MAFDKEPLNNSTLSPDYLGLLSGAFGASINFLLGPKRTVQSLTGSTFDGSTVVASVRDAVDYISLDIGTDVRSVKIKPGLITTPNLDRGHVIGTLTRVEYRPEAGFNANPIIIEARAGYARFQNDVNAQNAELNSLFNALYPDAVSGNVAAIADYNRMKYMSDRFFLLNEYSGANMSAARADQLAAQIRAKVAEGGFSVYSGRVNAYGTAIANILDHWHEVQYTLSRGFGTTVVSETTLTSFVWDVSLGATSGLFSVSGYQASFTTSTVSQPGRWVVSPLDVSSAEIHVGTLTNGTGVTVGSSRAETLSGTNSNDALHGLAGHDTLLGYDGADALFGGAGNDTLDGGTGMDTMLGGIGNDTYIVDNDGDTVIEEARSGTDTVKTTVTWTLGDNIENLVLEGAQPINGSGNALPNTITGNSEMNLLDGGAGADVLIGGGGDDHYYLFDRDRVVETAGGGEDAVHSWLTNYVLPAHVENLFLSGPGNINGTGNALPNFIQGHDGINRINGGAGDDEIDGSLGADILTGGAGADRFYYWAPEQRYVPGQACDTITDFSQRQGDKIEVSRVGFPLSITTLDTTTFEIVSTGGATQATTRFFYNTTTDKLYYDSDGSGTGATADELAFFSTRSLVLRAEDILLVV